jgi:Fic family protein
VAKGRRETEKRLDIEVFQPVYTLPADTAAALMRIEAVRQSMEGLPINPRVLNSLRETARLFSTHYSTMIEGNRLTQLQVNEVIAAGDSVVGRERDEAEVKGYYAALDEVERLAQLKTPVSEAAIQKLHGLVMGGGRARAKATPYRDGQNVIRDSRTQGIVYLPPEAKDVAELMGRLVAWINRQDGLPAPLKAGIAHYQFATIHPYYDGNGRTARLLTTLVLHLTGYDLKGMYVLEEYYARDLQSYYDALAAGPSHNYYLGRAKADITRWVAYFIDGMAEAFEKVREQARRESQRGGRDQANRLRELDAKQRKALGLFRKSREITAKEVARMFRYQPRTATELCQKWVQSGFLVMSDPAKKSRKYRLADVWEQIVTGM